MYAIDLNEVASHAIELGYKGDDLAYIQEALEYYGVDVDIADKDGNTSGIILEVETVADRLLRGK